MPCGALQAVVGMSAGWKCGITSWQTAAGLSTCPGDFFLQFRRKLTRSTHRLPPFQGVENALGVAEPSPRASPGCPGRLLADAIAATDPATCRLRGKRFTAETSCEAK